MLKRTILIESPSHLQIENDLLKITNKSTSTSETLTIDDIGFIILENNQSTTTVQFFQKVAEYNSIVVICDKSHTPISLTIPLYSNKTQTQTINKQTLLTAKDKNTLWKQLIQSKVKNQAILLKTRNQVSNQLERLSNNVTEQTANTVESTASRIYWKLLFNIKKFKRDAEGDPPNNLLNYGYAILRACVARSLVGSGLLPTLGIFHKNQYNAYCLADDIMEPYRPFVDRLVSEIIKNEDELFELTPSIKKQLLGIPVIDVRIDSKKSPLMNAISRTTSSLARCFEGDSRKILYPTIK